MRVRRFLHIFALLLIITACGDTNKGGKIITVAENIFEADQISRDIEVLFVDSSFTKAILTGTVAKIYEERRETIIDSGLTVTFMSKNDGGVASVLTAFKAKIDDVTQNMIAEGDVLVVSDSTNTTLRTSRLEWLNDKKKLYSTAYVEIESPNEIIKGYGFESDPNLTNYVIHNVSGIQQINN